MENSKKRGLEHVDLENVRKCSKHMAEIRVITYNVLSSGLCEDSHFPKCNPKWLDPLYRLVQLKKKLKKEMNKKAIICLQEVSTEWACDLHVFFLGAGYYFVHALYGKKFGGYMGVAIAVPLEQYSVSSIIIDRVGDSIPSSLINSDMEHDPWAMAAQRNNQLLTVALLNKDTEKMFNVSNYHMPCMFRYPKVMLIHCTLAALLAARHATSTASMCVPYILMGDFNITPKSDSFPYKYLTESIAYKCPTSTDAIAKLDVYPDKFNVLLALFNCEYVDKGIGLRSVYKEFLGAEPDFTNYAMVAWNSVPPAAKTPVERIQEGEADVDYSRNAFSFFNPSSWFSLGGNDAGSQPERNPAMKIVEAPKSPEVETFCDTLDYIFLSKSDWNIVEVVSLKHRDDYSVYEDSCAEICSSVESVEGAAIRGCHQTPGEWGGPLPNEFECSDHVMLGCTLML